ncbi:hypothetical protein GGI25_002128 [Coemansia spiralis]|uniref:Uncharacterized protein n=2 Tax=Coemansia TaxID=4863 RepID=A0A9W8KXT6_9FUNG|nr:hypothetical protein BX070DRAFT_260567 [Coemansia spiralis]KAJ1995210.1 hypothetical protein EDC05_001048 [Coemansia umbellata]KAJ2625612.1 hypothetical protein GGI26_000412 [Coemansia sp. RSA 1358]KAJ2678743.1 hypothetical protein GGI25_002128 [Coemansia spiralis]
MPLVTFDVNTSIEDEQPVLAATTADTTGSTYSATLKWQEGRAERIQSLEAALSATARRRQQHQQQKILKPDYSSMLDSESGGYDSSDENQSKNSDGGDGDAWSDSSSIFYCEGQPLLCTYQPPAMPSTIASSAGTYGSLSRQTAEVKTPEQYLPWDVRAWNRARQLCFSICICSAAAQESGSAS